jgi:anti-sigma factor (TIGR02949 family)
MAAGRSSMSQSSRLTCEETFRRLNDYLDRSLSAGEVRLVEAHLATCEQCANEYRFEGTLIEEVRKKVGRLQVPDGLKTRIADKLHDAMQESRTES